MADPAKKRIDCIWAFDCNDTLENLQGPVTYRSIRDLKAATPNGLFGLAGHWWQSVPTEEIQAWCDFVGPFTFKANVHKRKRRMLQVLQDSFEAGDYVIVGNDGQGKSGMPGHSMSDEKSLAEELGWRFILAQDFASGRR